jgi:hypothetical protein
MARRVSIAPVATLFAFVVLARAGDDETPGNRVKQLLAESPEVAEAARQWLVCNSEAASGALNEAVRGDDKRLAVAASRVLTLIHAPWGTPKGDDHDRGTGLARRIADNKTGIELVFVAESGAARPRVLPGRERGDGRAVEGGAWIRSEGRHDGSLAPGHERLVGRHPALPRANGLPSADGVGVGRRMRRRPVSRHGRSG